MNVPRWIALWLLLGVLVWSALPALAQEGDAIREVDPREQVPLDLDSDLAPSPVTEPTRDALTGLNPAPSLTRYLFGVVVWLAICIALIYGLVAMLKVFYRRFPGAAPHGMVETLASLPVAAGVALHVVRFHDVVLILAATGNGVSLIDKVEDPDRVALLVKSFSHRPSRANPASFGEVLKRTQRRMGFTPMVPTGIDSAEILHELEEGLATPVPTEPRIWIVGDEADSLEAAEKLQALHVALEDWQAVQSPPPGSAAGGVR